MAEDPIAEAFKTYLASKTSGAGEPPKTLTIGGRVMGWNSQTQQFDIDYGPAGTGGGGGGSSGPTVVQLTNMGNPGATASVTEDRLRESGYSEPRPGYWVRKEQDGTMTAYEARRSPDGSLGYDDVTQRDWSVNNKQAGATTRNRTPGEIAAESWSNVKGMGSGTAQPLGEGATSQGQGIAGSQAQPLGGPSLLYGPGKTPISKPSLSGLFLNNPGGSTSFTPASRFADSLATVGMQPSGDPEKDLQTMAGIESKRNMLWQMGYDPLQAQAMLEQGQKQLKQTIQPGELVPNGGRRTFTGQTGGYTPLSDAEARQFVNPQEYDALFGMAGGGQVEVAPAPVSNPYVPDEVQRYSTNQYPARAGGFAEFNRVFADPYSMEDIPSAGSPAGLAIAPWVGQRLANLYGRPYGAYYPQQNRSGRNWTFRDRPGAENPYAGNSQGALAQLGAIPGMASGGKLVTNEPMTVVGDWSGQPQAKLGEVNALTGQPTREIMDVQPLEPSVPMTAGGTVGPQGVPYGQEPPMGPQRKLVDPLVLRALAAGISRRINLALPAGAAA